AGVTRVAVRCLRILGLASHGRRRLELLTEAVTLGSGSPPRLEQLHALVEHGAAIRATVGPAAAREPLSEALRLCRERGAVVLAQRAADEIAAGRSRRARPRAAGLPALTPTERRVATLAAQGATTREIAVELFVSPKTVEFHLRNVYRKLAIPATRAELARAFEPATPSPSG
ncbi:MAG: helix-turn-helix transcriptional regulator, partial [Solirubrobacteraceae bacterium]